MTEIASSAVASPRRTSTSPRPVGRSNIRPRVGLRRSASIRRVSSPALAHRPASCAARVVLPSPPLALVMRMLRRGPAPRVAARADRDPEVVQALDEPVEVASRPGRGAAGRRAGAGQRRDHAQDVEPEPARAGRRGRATRPARSSTSDEQAEDAREHPHRRRGHRLDPAVGVRRRDAWAGYSWRTGRPGPGPRIRPGRGSGDRVEHRLGPAQVLAGELQGEPVGAGRPGPVAEPPSRSLSCPSRAFRPSTCLGGLVVGPPPLAGPAGQDQPGFIPRPEDVDLRLEPPRPSFGRRRGPGRPGPGRPARP